MKTKERIFLFDNVKFFLILLVVIGHFIDPIIGKSEIYKNLYTFIYIFHMPLFILISGYFSKNFYKNGKIKVYKLIQYMLLYFFLIFSQEIIMKLLTGNFPKINLLKVSNIPWYLLAMTIWSITIPFIYNLKPKYVMTFSIIVGIIAGLDNNITDFLAFSRVLVFYPFFLAGYYLEKKQLQKMLNKKYNYFFVVFFLIAIFIIFNNNIPTYSIRPLLTGRNPYEISGYGYMGIIYRSIYYIIAFLFIIGILNISPKKELPIITKFGSRTLQVYVLHFIIIKFMSNTSFYQYFIKYVPCWKLSLLILAIITTFILSSKFFELPFKKLNECKFEFLNKK